METVTIETEEMDIEKERERERERGTHTQEHIECERILSSLSRGEDEGLCGVPTFQVNGSRPIWGQDRLHVVADMLCGWKETLTASKL